MKFQGVGGILDPLMHPYINKTPKWHIIAQKRVIWAIMPVRAIPRGRYAIAISDYVWRGFESARGRFLGFPSGSCYSPNNNALRYRAVMW